MNIGEIMGGLLGQASLGRPRGMSQMHAIPVMHMPPFMGGPFGRPSHSPFMHNDFDDPFGDDLEDPFDVIRQMEHSRRAGPMFGSMRSTPRLDTRPALIDEHNPWEQQHDAPKAVHNDMQSHSPLYMFGCVFVIAAIGYFLYVQFIKGEAGGAMSDMLRQKRRK